MFWHGRHSGRGYRRVGKESRKKSLKRKKDGRFIRNVWDGKRKDGGCML
jgi:hypothetical protein